VSVALKARLRSGSIAIAQNLIEHDLFAKTGIHSSGSCFRLRLKLNPNEDSYAEKLI
jgi:hypothetical protein